MLLNYNLSLPLYHSLTLPPPHLSLSRTFVLMRLTLNAVICDHRLDVEQFEFGSTTKIGLTVPARS